MFPECSLIVHTRAAMKCERKLAGAVMLSSFVGPADDLKPGKTSAANAKVTTSFVIPPVIQMY
jgi:hypothetical protein